jgi:predicted secreted protein
MGGPHGEAPLRMRFLNAAEFVRPALCAMALICLGPGLSDGGTRPAPQDPRETVPPPRKHPTTGTRGNVVTASERNDGKEVTLSSSDTLEIRLTSVPGTGYGWKLAGLPPEVLRLEEERLDVTGSASPGAAATSILRFVPVSPGKGAIRLVYARPWEKGVPPKKTYTLRVHVR